MDSRQKLTILVDDNVERELTVIAPAELQESDRGLGSDDLRMTSDEVFLEIWKRVRGACDDAIFYQNSEQAAQDEKCCTMNDLDYRRYTDLVNQQFYEDRLQNRSSSLV